MNAFSTSDPELKNVISIYIKRLWVSVIIWIAFRKLLQETSDSGAAATPSQNHPHPLTRKNEKRQWQRGAEYQKGWYHVA